MSEVASAFVTLVPSAKGFSSKLNGAIGGDVDKAGKTSGSRFGKVFATASMSPLRAFGAAAVALFAVDKVKDFFGSAIDEARESQKVSALTAQVIKTTGGAANISAKQIGNLSTAISNKVGIDDEAIQSGANMLLTFTNVRNEVGKGNKVFNEATRLATDMSAALGGDAKSAALQLGKALNDPAKGVTKLARSGVSFTEQQIAQIKAMQESGNVLGAQKIILGEVSKEFGGAAAASATAGEKMGVAWGNLKEQIGTALLPALDAVESGITSHVIPALSSFVSSIGPAFSRVGAFLSPFIAQIQGFFGDSGGSAIAAFGTQIATVFNGQLLPVLQRAGTTFATVVLPAIRSLVTYVASSLWPAFQQFVSIIATNVIPIVASLASFIYGTLYPAVVRIATAVATNLKPVFDQLVATFRGSVLPALQQLLAKFREWQPTIQRVIGVIVQVVGKVLEFAAAVLGKVLPVAIRFAGFLISTLVPAVIGVITVLARIVGTVADVVGAFARGVAAVVRFASAVGKKVAEVISIVRGLPGKITAALGDLGKLLYGAGQRLIGGLVEGIKSKAGDIAHAMSGIASTIKDHLPGSPVKEGPLMSWNHGNGTSAAGRRLIASLAEGIEAGAPWIKSAMEKVLGALSKQVDAAKTKLSDLKSQFASIKDGISQAFVGDVFSVGATTNDAGDAIAGTITSNFTKQLSDTHGTLGQLTAAFQKLKKWGLGPKFLSQLFQSGNSGLILEMASGDKATALTDQQLFNQNATLASQLGTSVATNQFGQQINVSKRQLDRLERIDKHIQSLSKEFAKEINRATVTAKKGRVA